MRIISAEELKEILDKHKKWLNEEDGGERADLRYADLSNANLYNADLRYADLYNADLSNANLYNADLRYADLRYADLRNADLRYADLRYADLRYADLDNADLRYADLRYADLRYADLRNANLYNADLDEKEKIRCGMLLKEDFHAYKKCREDLIVELIIPKGSIVFSINNSKCRTNRAKVVSITDIEGTTTYNEAVSQHNDNFIYKVGAELEIEDFDLMYNVECSTGIHFFRTREEAVNYNG